MSDGLVLLNVYDLGRKLGMSFMGSLTVCFLQVRKMTEGFLCLLFRYTLFFHKYYLTKH